MKKLLYLFLVLGLSLSSCKKEDSNGKPENIITLDGKDYELEAVTGEISRFTGIAVEDLAFDKENLSYTHVRYSDMVIKISDYLPHFEI